MSTRSELAHQLSLLRQAAGFSVRDLAARLGMPPGTLGGYLSGRHLPSASQLMTYTALLRECGVTEPDEVHRWIDALTRARSSSDGRAARREAPYRGLEPFGTADAEWFFGRDALTRLLVDRLVALRAAANPASRIVPLIGASGSGKSSLLNAGLVPAVSAGALGADRGTALLTPGADPRAALRAVIDELDAAPAVLVVDQLEELFTLCTDADQRRGFLDELARLGAAGSSVVVGMRADFYAAAMTQPVLVAALQHNQVLVTPLREDELRAAIVEPARRAGLTVEPALVDAVLADLAPAGVRDRAHDHGALPLMSHALLSTWSRSRRRELTLPDYRAAGGIAGAVQQTAEELFTGLDAEDQEISRRLFLRLVNVGDDAVLTRRRIAYDEIANLSPAGVEGLVDTYVGRRLLTVELDTVQISHEALLVAWPRLHDWIDTDREGLRLHRQLTEAANLWERAGHDPALLLVGARLSTISGWASEAGRPADLNPAERRFLDESVAADVARREASHRQNRRLKRLLTLAATLTVVAAVLAVLAWRASVTADDQRRRANDARDQALSRQLAGEATALQTKDPNLAAQLAATAFAVSPTDEARSALLASTGHPLPTRLAGSAGPLQAVAIGTPTRLLAAAGADGLVHLWRTGGAAAVPTALPALHPSGGGTLFAVAISPDGTLLAAGGADRLVDLWSVKDAAHPQHIGTLHGFGNTVYALAFSPDGRVLAAGSADQTLRRWTMEDPTHPTALGTAAHLGSYVQALAFDAGTDGERLAIGTFAGEVIVFDDAEKTRVRETYRIPASPNAPVLAVAFDPASGLLAAGGHDAIARLWHLPASGTPVLVRAIKGFSSQINALDFDPHRDRLLVGTSDDQLAMYSTRTWGSLGELPHPEAVTAVAVDEQGDQMITVCNDGMVRLWPRVDRTLAGPAATVFSLTDSATGVLAVGTGSADGHVELWRLGPRPGLLGSVRSMVDGDALDGASAISPDGGLLAAGSEGGRVGLWDVSDPGTPTWIGVLPGIETSDRPVVEGVAFSADSHLLAAGGDDGLVRVWDVSDPAQPRALAVLSDPSNYVFCVAFSPDGRYLAAASADDHAYVWPLHDGHPGPLLDRVGGFDSYVYSVAFSPTGDLLAVGGANGTARLLRVRPHGPTVPVGGRLVGPTDGIYALAFSPDGKRLAGASQDGAIYLWKPSAHTRAALATGASTSAVTFDPSGSTVIGSGADQLIHLWSPSSRLARDTICAVAGTPLTRKEWARYVPGKRYDPLCRSSQP